MGSRRTKAEILGSTAGVLASKFVGRNTVRWEGADGATRYRLHNTDVVTVHKNGIIELETGGWNTPTTRDRMNSFSPYNVFTDKGVLYVSTSKGRFPIARHIKIKPDGTPVGLKKIKREVARQQRQADMIKKFCRQILTIEKIPLPSNGDCWGCLMMSQDGKYMMEDCIWQHVRENYLHGALIVRAMRARGHSDTGIAVYLNNGSPDKWQRKVIARALRIFLRAHMGIGNF